MARIKFYKYAHLGNHFVLIDELRGKLLSEIEKKSFSAIATDPCHGIGSDNFLCIEAYSPEQMRMIRKVRGYLPEEIDRIWNIAPDIIFRIFEPDGSEALCCGNGLLCIAKHIYEHYAMEKALVVTEVPTKNPIVRTILAGEKEDLYRVKLGPAKKLLSPLVHISCVEVGNSGFLKRTLPFKIKGIDGLHSELILQGFLVYIGEPHFVIIKSAKSSENTLPSTFQSIVDAMLDPENEHLNSGDKKMTQNGTLFHTIGSILNNRRSSPFAHGININIARVEDKRNAVISCRFYERGINKETSTCGTGAVAVAATAFEMNMIDKENVTLLPVKERRINEHAVIKVWRDNDDNWWLEGKPRAIYEGIINF